MHIYLHIHLYIHLYIHFYIHLYTFIYTFLYTFLYMHIYLHIHLYIHVYIYIYIHMCFVPFIVLEVGLGSANHCTIQGQEILSKMFSLLRIRSSSNRKHPFGMSAQLVNANRKKTHVFPAFCV